MAVKLFLMAYQYIEILQSNLQYLEVISNIPKDDIVIIDMGIDKEIKAWLECQNEFDYICAEGLENYASILNTAINEFSSSENIFLLNANLICLGDCIPKLEKYCDQNEKIGAVVPEGFASICQEKVGIKEATNMIAKQIVESDSAMTMKIPYQYVYMSRKFIDDIGEMDESLFLPHNIMLDYSFRGLCKKWKFIVAKNAFVYEMIPHRDIYTIFLGREADNNRLKLKWEMNYFNLSPNIRLVSSIKKQKNELFTVLEVGCDCGANLMQIKNLYPKAEIFGIEINSKAAEIASAFGEIASGNIEDYNLPYEKKSFDYILFGDVLEHLRNPEKVIAYCRQYLKPQGKIIANIPNLMHYTVLKGLVNGDFTYQDTGLLDRTHIHFFTYNEILKMFSRAEYKIEECVPILMPGISEKDTQFVAQMIEIGNCEIFMYLAYQYLVVAGLNEEDSECFLPQFRSDEETIRLIIEEKKSLGRFGDGEFAIAFDVPRQKFQRTDPRLRDRIRQVITQTDNSDMLIGIANHYGNLERYNAQAKYGIEIYLTEEVRKQHMSLLSPDKVYSDTYMTRPYVIFKDVFTDAPKERFKNLKKIWNGKNIIIVEGAETRLGVGNDLFDNAKTIQRILAPATSSFDRYDDILAKCEENASLANLFVLAIGPSSGVLAYDLSKQGIQAVDVGHIDMEYEWFLAGKGVRVAVPNKYNNEVLDGDKVSSNNLPEKYISEIIADFSS